MTPENQLDDDQEPKHIRDEYGENIDEEEELSEEEEEEEEEELEDSDNEEYDEDEEEDLLKRLEAKYGKLKSNDII